MFLALKMLLVHLRSGINNAAMKRRTFTPIFVFPCIFGQHFMNPSRFTFIWYGLEAVCADFIATHTSELNMDQNG